MREITPASGKPEVLIGGSAVGVGSLAAVLIAAGAPWQIVAVVIVTGPVCVTVVSVVRLTFPQHSRDRLNWWRDRRRHRKALRAERPTAGRRTKRARCGRDGGTRAERAARGAASAPHT